MKYFTRQLYDSIQEPGRITSWFAHRRWKQAGHAYAVHFAGIKPTLPPSALEFSKLSLHDGQIQSASLADDVVILNIKGHGYWGPHASEMQPSEGQAKMPGTVGFVLPHREPNGVTVTFSGVQVVEGLKDIPGDSWLYDEFDSGDTGAFEFRALLVRSEFRLVARDVTVTHQLR